MSPFTLLAETIDVAGGHHREKSQTAGAQAESVGRSIMTTQSDDNKKPRIGVYVCQCGSNIAATVDTEAVAEFAQELDGVVLTRVNKYSCSDPGRTPSARISRSTSWTAW